MSDDHIRAPKSVVWVSLLLELFLICREPGCGSTVDRSNIKTSFQGASFSVSTVCNSNHSFKVRRLIF